jgi:very-short-patch-repair endonuclease
MTRTMRPKSMRAFRQAAERRLRASQTRTERTLWDALHALPLAGTHFRRQMPIGPYVVDIACPAAKLIIEVDGAHHGLKENADRDAARTRWLEQEGYRVLRFWNSDITDNQDGVLEAIYAAIYGSIDAEPRVLKHERTRSLSPVTPPRDRRAARADLDPPPPGEGEDPLLTGVSGTHA